MRRESGEAGRGSLAAFLVPVKFAAIDFLKRTGESTINRRDYHRQIILEDVPFYGRQRHNSQIASFEVLLMEQRPIASQKDLDTAFFSDPQKFAVPESGPASITDGENLMRAKVLAQAVREVFVEQNLHRWACLRCAWANSIRRMIWATESEGQSWRMSSMLSPMS